jgi:hypothetical protein
MYPQSKFSLSILLLNVVSLFIAVPALATTHIISPEDNSVYIDQRDPDENKSSKAGLLTASAVNENARIVIHFDLTGWGTDSISQAKLFLYHYRGGDYTGSRTINVYPLTSGFDESTATWNFPWITSGGDYDTSISASADIPEEWENWVEWDATDILIGHWNDVVDFGFLIRDPVEDTDAEDEPYVRFHSHRKDSFLPYLEILTAPTDVEYVDDENTYKAFSLGQNFPNPFNNKMLVEFELSKSAGVNLTIYNIQGRKVKTLLDAKKQAGTHVLEWDATDEHGKPVSSGVYLYRLQTEDFSQTKRLLYLK